MHTEKSSHVYIVASRSGTLYIGVTADLVKRMFQHKNGSFEGFSKKYGCTRLVYYESFGDIIIAIQRETQLKNWNRKKKEWLIANMNPKWLDLSDEWFS